MRGAASPQNAVLCAPAASAAPFLLNIASENCAPGAAVGQVQGHQICTMRMMPAVLSPVFCRNNLMFGWSNDISIFMPVLVNCFVYFEVTKNVKIK